MPATALPSSGESRPEPRPSGIAAAKTCDASGMAEIHRMFRAGFGEAPTLVAGVADGDVVHAEVVSDHLRMLSVGLHAHHEGEDAMLWDALGERAPSCSVHVQRIEGREVHEQLGVLGLHALHVHAARRGPLAERIPKHGVLAFVMGVQPDRQHAEVVAHHLGVHDVAVGHSRDEGRPLTEAGPEHAMDLGHAARVARLGHDHSAWPGLGPTVTTLGKRGCGHPDSDRVWERSHS